MHEWLDVAAAWTGSFHELVEHIYANGHGLTKRARKKLMLAMRARRWKILNDDDPEFDTYRETVLREEKEGARHRVYKSVLADLRKQGVILSTDAARTLLMARYQKVRGLKRPMSWNRAYRIGDSLQGKVVKTDRGVGKVTTIVIGSPPFPSGKAQRTYPTVHVTFRCGRAIKRRLWQIELAKRDTPLTDRM